MQRESEYSSGNFYRTPLNLDRDNCDRIIEEQCYSDFENKSDITQIHGNNRVTTDIRDRRGVASGEPSVIQTQRGGAEMAGTVRTRSNKTSHEKPRSLKTAMDQEFYSQRADKKCDKRMSGGRISDRKSNHRSERDHSREENKSTTNFRQIIEDYNRSDYEEDMAIQKFNECHQKNKEEARHNSKGSLNSSVNTCSQKLYNIDILNQSGPQRIKNEQVIRGN